MSKPDKSYVTLKTSAFMKFKFIVEIIVFLVICLAGVYFYLNWKKTAEKIETIYELRAIVKNLKANYPVAKLQITDVNTDTISINISYYKQDGSLFFDKDQEFSIFGNTIYIDCISYNFAFSLIETGDIKNFAIPVKVYSDIIAPKEGVSLKNKDTNGVPLVLYDTVYLENQQIKELQHKRLEKFMSVIDDPKKAEELGILRTIQKTALGNAGKLKKGYTYILFIEQTGGLTLKKKGLF